MDSAATQKKSILKKTFEVGITTFVSRMLGLAREILLMRYLGLGVFADAFTTAFMLPNSLRKVFAEGALSAAFVPTFITVSKKEGKDAASGLMALSFVVFESALLGICALVMWKAAWVIQCIAPGYSAESVTAAVPLLRILMPFIFFISSSALLGGALNSVQHFFIPAVAPVILNGAFIGGILLCLQYDLSVEFLCWVIMAAGFVQLITHMMAYKALGFSFARWDGTTWSYFGNVVVKFFLCFFSMSVMEISLFVDQGFASYLQVGTVTLIKYANRFMGIPLGVFAVAFSTILLPHFTRVKIEEPGRIHFYFLEATKFVLWVTIPATLMLMFLADEVFITLFASTSSKFPVERIGEAGTILIGFVLGLCCFSLNKILFSLYYSFHDTLFPTIISVIATALNIGANYYLVDSYGAFGLALATSLSGLVQTILSFFFLYKKHGLVLDAKEMALFIGRYTFQVLLVMAPFVFIYKYIFAVMQTTKYAHFLTASFGFWLWVGPLLLSIYGILFLARRVFKIELHFLD